MGLIEASDPETLKIYRHVYEQSTKEENLPMNYTVNDRCSMNAFVNTV